MPRRRGMTAGVANGADGQKNKINKGYAFLVYQLKVKLPPGKYNSLITLHGRVIGQVSLTHHICEPQNVSLVPVQKQPVLTS